MRKGSKPKAKPALEPRHETDPAGEVPLFRGIDYANLTTEEAMARESQALESAFTRRAKAEADRFLTTCDSEYWFALHFDSREQKEAFLERIGWTRFGDKYLDGVQVAAQLGIPLPPTPAALKFVTEKSDRSLNELSLPL